MRAESAFLAEISKLKRIVFFKFVHRILLWALLVLLGAVIMALLIEKAGLSEYHLYPAIFTGGVIIGLIALRVVFLKRRKFLDILIDIDTRLKLQDRIATAYEYQRSEIKSVFLDLLMQDAATRLRQLSNKQLFAVKFSVLHVSVILMFITSVMLYSSDYLIHSFKPIPDEYKIIEEARKMVRNYTMSRSEDNKAQKAKQHTADAGRWEHFQKTIEDPNLTRNQLFGATNEFFNAIQGEQTRLANELGSTLKDLEINERVRQDIVDPQNLSANNLEKLKMLLDRTSNHPIPDSVKQNIESLQDLYSMEKLLSQLLDDFSEEKSFTKAFTESGAGQKDTTASITDAENAPLLSKHPKRSGQAAAQKGGSADAGAQPGLGPSQGEARDVPDDTGFSQGFSSAPGRAKAADMEKAARELEKSTGPTLQDMLNSSQAKNYLIQIRSQTAIGEAKVREENILQAYRQAIESVLQKEEMPLNYRHYIKQYFVSIGMQSADSAPTDIRESDN